MNIIFDLDGTLIDSAPDIQYTASIVLGRHGKEPISLDDTRRFVGEGAAVFVRRMMAARNITETPGRHEALLEEFLVVYESAVDKAVFYPGVRETLATLRAQGHKLGLCTNKPIAPTRAVIQHMDLEHVFDTVVAGGTLTSRKPEPDMLLQAISNLGGGATLYIGDSEIDAETATRAHIAFALFSEGYRKRPVDEIQHDWVFADFGLLNAIVEDALRLSRNRSPQA